jgi:hypothetical protein
VIIKNPSLPSLTDYSKETDMNDENIKREDYIAVPPLKIIVIQFLRFIFSVVDLFFTAVKKHVLLLLIGLIAGLAGGFYFSSSASGHYEVSMIAESSIVNRKTLSEVIHSLNDLIAAQNYHALASGLGVNEDQARQINFVQLSTFFNETLENDTTLKYYKPFKITAYISGPGLTDTFQNSIVSYLNNKPYFKKIMEDQVKFHTEKLAAIEKDLAKLDTLKSEYNRFYASSKIATTYYSNEADPPTIYKQSNELIKEKGLTMLWLSSNSKPIMVIDEFKSPLLIGAGGSRNKSLLYGALAGLGIAFFLALYMELYRKVRNYHGQA